MVKIPNYYFKITALLIATVSSIGVSNLANASIDQSSAGNQCDELAAIPTNPDNPKDILGVYSESIDSEKAIAACMQAVAQNPKVFRYQFQLARAYQSLDDYKNALKLYRSLSQRGYAPAQTNLGTAYLEGSGVKKSYEKAVDLYYRAVEQGYAVAQNNLGVVYYRGIGVDESNTKAVDLYYKAAEQGYAVGQHNLGTMYESGLGVPQSDSEAKKWYQKAANQDYDLAIKKLQEMP